MSQQPISRADLYEAFDAVLILIGTAPGIDRALLNSVRGTVKRVVLAEHLDRFSQPQPSERK